MWKYFAVAATAYIATIAGTVAQVIKPLSIGEEFDTYVSFDLTNSKESLLNWPQVKEELILLDFWASWCTTCITKFPLLDSLQQQYKGQMKVLLVNWDEDSARINPFLRKYATRNKRSLSLPIITGDTVLRTLFPHQSIPHYVWIHRGKVLATTGPDMVNAERIEKVLRGEPVPFKMKRDVMDFDFNKHILDNGNGGGVEHQLYRSVLTRELEGLMGGYRIKRDSSIQRNMYINFPVLMLYHLALDFDLNRIMLELPDPLKYAGKSPELYCYELTAPANISKQSMHQLMLSDLDRYFSLEGRIEKREVECFVLKSFSGVKERATNPMGLTRGSKKAPGERESWRDEDGSVLHLRYVPFQIFVRDLNHSRLQWPCKPIIIDETGYTGKISIDLPTAADHDTSMLKRILQLRGFSLEKRRRVLNVFVLREK